DDQSSTGDAQTRNWVFTNLGIGQSVVIHLTAKAADPCAAPTLQNGLHVSGVNLCGGPPPTRANADTTVGVLCSAPQVTISPVTTCQGVATQLCAQVTGGTGPFHYAWTTCTGGPVGGDAACLDLSGSAVGTPGTFCYHVTVTDANSCTGSNNGNLTVAHKPQVTTYPVKTRHGT